jgi:LuxR family maltose regulon positive regulatory protein
VAAASWADGYDRGPVAWVRLDEFDNGPEVFWSYVLAALRRAGVAVSNAAAMLPRGEPTRRAFLLRIAAALAGQDPPVTLILDEFQCITEPKVTTGLAYLLRNAQPGLRLVCVSRADPPLPLHRYRLTGELTEIRARDLAFTVPEAAQLMSQHGVTLPTASLAHLTERSEGWAAGLRMAAMSMAGRPDPEQFVKSLVAEDSAITGYLMEEVLDTRSPEVRDLLLRTSILDQVNGDIATALTDGDQASAVLDAMAGGNAFVQRVGQGWYRYHDWFRAVLDLKLRRKNPQLVADLHRRAAGWYQQHGMLADALWHATKAADRELAARVITDGLAIGQLVGPVHGELPAAGFRGIPEGDASPQLLLAAAAVALSEARDEAAEASLAAAERILGGLPENQECAARFAAATFRFGIACRRGDLMMAEAAVAVAAKLLENPEAARAGHPEIVAQLLSGRGVVELWAGDLNTAAALFCQAAGLLDDPAYQLDPWQPVPAGRRHQLGTCRGYRALVDALRSRPKAAAKFAEAASSVPGAGLAAHRDPASALALALVYLDAGDLSAARGQLQIADAALRVQPHRLLTAIGGLVAARSRLAEGCACEAIEIIERARHGWSPPPWLQRSLTAAESQAHAACGDDAETLAAARWVRPESAPDARIALGGADRQFVGLATRDIVPAPRPAPDAKTPVIVDPLTSRERDVLRLVSEMLDTADIAAEMHISVNTVKTHLKSIFHKLGASDRRAAVRRAWQLNLL